MGNIRVVISGAHPISMYLRIYISRACMPWACIPWVYISYGLASHGYASHERPSHRHVSHRRVSNKRGCHWYILQGDTFSRRASYRRAHHGQASRRRASNGHTYLMGGYPVVVYLMGVDLSGRHCYPTPAYHCVEWHVVVCYGGPKWFRQFGRYGPLSAPCQGIVRQISDR
jgi:hypothetical protein